MGLEMDAKYVILMLLPIPAFFLSLFIGTYPLPPDVALGVLFGKIFSPFWQTSYPQVYETVIFDIRLPRIILAIGGGIALSVSGTSLQGLFKNPLVDSYILGVSAGAGLGAAIAIAFLPNVPGAVQVFSFLFGFMAFVLSYYVAKNKGETPIVSLVLAGIIVTALFSAGLSIIKFFTDINRMAGVVYWLMGSLAISGWGEVLQTLPIIIVGFMIIYFMRWRLNVLSMGDEEARALGVNIERDRQIVLIATTLMVSSFVSVAGVIGWIGLVVPHTVRMLMKTPDNRVIVPLSASIGAIFLLLADDLARSATSFELPVGVITTLIGAPFFLYLLKRRGGDVWR
ncbi:MAG: iron ABC transporter permease [Candidatus Methanomethylicus sp.]|nr:iron ABC transporter permease [Candidatus Methanomethylicus sp.]